MFSPIPLTDRQLETLDRYANELARMTRRVNLIAPSTIRQIEERHISHSLTLAQKAFPKGSTVVDWGSGGGLPAIPLAVVFPDVEFVAVDAVGKKTEAIRLFARRLGLANVRVWNGRAEAYDGPAPHYAVSRATAPLVDLWGWFAACRQLVETVPDGAWTPGLVCLKGGDLTDEVADLHSTFPGLSVQAVELASLLGEAWSDKVLLHVTG
ncbi:MAG: class I SAM-dependent methyltransferase [Rubricoccaceae bacterium]